MLSGDKKAHRKPKAHASLLTVSCSHKALGTDDDSRLRVEVIEGLGSVGDTELGLVNTVVIMRPGLVGTGGEVEEYSVLGIHRDIGIEVTQRGDDEAIPRKLSTR